MATTDRCPSVAHPLPRLDGGLARIRLPGGRITAGQLRAVADVAERHGNGVIELTNRANLQLRGVEGDVTAELERAGLSHGRLGDLRRNVMADPTADLGGLVDAIVAALDAAPGLDALSPKWGAAIDVAGRRDDVVVTSTGDRWEVRSLLGVERTTDVPDLVRRAAIASLHQPRRLVTAPGERREQGPLGVGPGWAAGMPWLGRLDPDRARAVAAAADAHSAGQVRVTPWRGLLFPGAGAAALEGLLADAADPATAVVACAGSAGCPSGLADAPADAARLAAALGRPVAAHVSGCAKRCAHPGPAPVTFVAVGTGRYDVRDGADRLVASGVGL